jgi:hypothetical protein
VRGERDSGRRIFGEAGGHYGEGGGAFGQAGVKKIKRKGAKAQRRKEEKSRFGKGDLLTPNHS